MDRVKVEPRWGSRLVLAVLTMAITGFLTGCQTVRIPEEKIAASNIPRELSMSSHPQHVIEPPDLIDVELLEGLPGRPIIGERLVNADGTINLGWYGNVYVAGLTLDEAKEKIVLHLRQFLNDEALGLFRESLDGSGKLEEVPPAQSDRVFVDLISNNSKYFYVYGDVATPGRFPVTGNERVLDAIGFAGGLTPTAANQNIRLVRPAPPGACCEQLLPINLAAIMNAGDPTTNYQLFPNDRIIVYRDPIVRTTVFMERLSQPFQIVLNTALSFNFFKQSLRFLSVPINGTGGVATGTGTTATGSGIGPVNFGGTGSLGR